MYKKLVVHIEKRRSSYSCGNFKYSK